MFESDYLNIVNTGLVLNDYFEQNGKLEDALDNDSNDQNYWLNAFELLSSLHKEKQQDKLGQIYYIDIVYYLSKHDDKVSDADEIQTFQKKYKTIEANESGEGIESNDIVLSSEQNEVLDICKHKLNEIKKSNAHIANMKPHFKRIIVQGKGETRNWKKYS